ncbi:thiamine biosynthesis protein ThiS [beta proteobacterium KB13]|uniref:Thiamine biosynthesis protein ThiS n=2 Tax=OM43 clade TaxID=1233498 RepID=A0A0H4J2A9_9PROT|nr:thiamine biosynthesis protein ThiS [Methylophilales bacterium MBRSF5]AKO65873.1 thiamine biosynthesis protein ThiS [Methylophilales bacterium MBRS-H7]AKO67193.1 thiamine biosynthesis protein ThiS [Methylophilales bacterium MBRSG12]EDZ64974.1 thiamine biosynthesis protein ThiS [beta proteobacterium KB13]
MKIWVNGEIKNFEENLTVYNLVEEIGVASKKFAVECNGEIIPKSSLKDTLVKEGDKFEIVGAVGGG